MYKIVIMSGGTGSVALQEGFSLLYGKDNYCIDIIINAYDNGKSTGACRKVFGNMILGPSDLRKNHMVQFKIQYGKEINDYTSREAALFRLFNMRIDGKDKEEYYNKATDILFSLRNSFSTEDISYLKSLIDYFFFDSEEDFTNDSIRTYRSKDINDSVFADKRNTNGYKWRRTLDDICFNDFSIANIFYSSEAALNDFSMRLAGKRMADFLRIKDNVHLISDVNLFLGAKTESGSFLADEGEIVKWNNPNDRITSVLLMKEGKEYIPSVDEGTDTKLVRSVKDIISESDLIVFSSGTQWSSLIPSYMHSGFREMINKAHAKKYVVVNNEEDYDMKGLSADDIIRLIGKYISMDDFKAVVNKDAVSGMNKETVIRSISGHISGEGEKHNPIKLVKLIMEDFFGITDDYRSYNFVYDLDGTLWDERENNSGKAVGAENLNIFDGIIHSGNNYEHVRDVFKYLYHQDKTIQIYSDFGNVHFTSKDYEIKLLSDKYMIDSDVAKNLKKIEEFRGKVIVRGSGCVITIKPLINREVLLKVIKKYLEKYDGLYVASISGYTSIDIMHREYNKKTMLPLILKDQGIDRSRTVFVGNELDNGAEQCIRDLYIKTIQVNDLYECNLLLKTIHL